MIANFQWDSYGRLKRVEKLLEFNLSLLDRFEELLLDHLEELEEYSQILLAEERVFLEKLRAAVRTILSHIRGLKDLTENRWEAVEFAILRLSVYGRDDFSPESFTTYVDDVKTRLDVLRDFVNFHGELFKDELQRYGLFQKFPVDVYIEFLDRLAEFNSRF
jgi:hypothetical protein